MTESVLSDEKMAFAIPIFKKGKGQPWEIQANNLHCSPWEYYVTSFQEAIPRHMNDKTAVINSQHGFTKTNHAKPPS